MRLTGIHHVTLICRDLARTTAFYRDLLGMALVSEESSNDDPDARHFVFGDADGTPGTLLTFLEYASMPEAVVGIGAAHHVALAVDSDEEQEAWRDYLRGHGVQTSEILDRGSSRSIYLRDPDGHILEIATRGPGYGARPPAD